MKRLPFYIGKTVCVKKPQRIVAGIVVMAGTHTYIHTAVSCLSESRPGAVTVPICLHLQEHRGGTSQTTSGREATVLSLHTHIHTHKHTDAYTYKRHLHSHTHINPTLPKQTNKLIFSQPMSQINRENLGTPV